MTKGRIRITRGKIVGMVLLILLLCGTLYVFLPRRLSAVCLNGDPETLSGVTVYAMPNGTEQGAATFELTDSQEIEDFRELLCTVRVRPKLFRTAYVNGGYEGYSFSLYESGTYNEKDIFLFTADLITVNGRQFVLYDTDFSDKLQSLLHS